MRKRRSIFARVARIAFTFVTLNVVAVQALFSLAFDREVWKK
jgi:hypothetical protein